MRAATRIAVVLILVVVTVPLLAEERRAQVPLLRELPSGQLVILHRGSRVGPSGDYRLIAYDDTVFDTLTLLEREHPGLLRSFGAFVERGDDFSKAAALRAFEQSGLRRLVSARRIGGPIDLSIFSDLPVVKGLANVTEDITETYWTECTACGPNDQPSQLCNGQCVLGCWLNGADCIIIRPRPR